MGLILAKYYIDSETKLVQTNATYIPYEEPVIMGAPKNENGWIEKVLCGEK